MSRDELSATTTVAMLAKHRGFAGTAAVSQTPASRGGRPLVDLGLLGTESAPDLLRLYGSLLDELKERGVLRSTNNRSTCASFSLAMTIPSCDTLTAIEPSLRVSRAGCAERTEHRSWCRCNAPRRARGQQGAIR